MIITPRTCVDGQRLHAHVRRRVPQQVRRRCFSDNQQFVACIADINAWLSACRLRLCEDAATVSGLQVSCWTRSTAMTSWCSALASPSRTPLAISVLSSTVSDDLSLSAHVTAICRARYNQLRQLKHVVRSLSLNATKTLVQAFISYRLNYCNSLLYGISYGLLQRLQLVQNAAARLWSQAPVVVTTSDQRCGSCTGCQFVSESRLRSRGTCISRSLVLLPRILLTTLIFCLMLVVAR